jgi:hypothetical protein
MCRDNAQRDQPGGGGSEMEAETGRKQDRSQETETQRDKAEWRD